MKKKSSIIVILLVILGTSGWFIIDQTKYTTYESVISAVIDENANINEIEIEDMRNHRITYSDSQDVFQKITQNTNSMQLKESDELPKIDYIITIKTNKGTYDMFLGEKSVHINTMGIYEIVEQNTLYDNVENTDFEWEDKQ